MDPSKSQSESNKEANSLENADTEIETGKQKGTPGSYDSSDTSAVIDTTGGNTSAGPGNDTTLPNVDPSGKKLPLLKRMGRRFNIYLLLFILVVLIAVGVTLGLFLKDRQ